MLWRTAVQLLNFSWLGLVDGEQNSSFIQAGEPNWVIGPLQTVTWTGDSLRVSDGLLSSWHRFYDPVGTICITGDDRIGKSTLLTLWGRHLLQREDFSFTVGHNENSTTQGLWSALLPRRLTGLPQNIDLCDSQGLKQVSADGQSQLFAANVFVPQVLIYMTINVVQNDQIRDMAHLANQFRRLSDEERSRFGKVVSPHLIVVVRNINRLWKKQNLTQHLEDRLHGPDYEEDKRLIREVFRTRESWVLEEMNHDDINSLSVRDDEQSGPVPPGSLPQGKWRNSGQTILLQALEAFKAHEGQLPTGGAQLHQWYSEAVHAATAGRAQIKAVSRFVGHGEQLQHERRRRKTLEASRGMMWRLLLLVGALLAWGIVGFEWWLNRIACFAWVGLVVCHVGASPLITAPIHGLVLPLCEQHCTPVWQFLCRELSPYTASMVIAALFGLGTYPLLTMQLRWLLNMMPVGLLQQCSVLGIAVVVGVHDILQEHVQSYLEQTSLVSFCAFLCLWTSLGVAGFSLGLAKRHNQACARARQRGLELHFWISERIEEVSRLGKSAEWKTHYSKNNQTDAIWRYRHRPTRFHTCVTVQAACLLAWSWLIHPNCDAVFIFGASLNLAYVLWRVLRYVFSVLSKGVSDPVQDWLDQVNADNGPDNSAEVEEDAGHMDHEMVCDAAATRSSELDKPQGRYDILPETAQEISTRQAIESMRREQDKSLSRCCIM